MAPEKLFQLVEVAREAGVSASTLRRWLRLKKVPEPGKDRNGWRVWTSRELKEVVAYAQGYQAPAHRRQAKLFREEEDRRAGA
jgi:site-specific DNA-methyltransferase (cytosine-N4-specific)